MKVATSSSQKSSSSKSSSHGHATQAKSNSARDAGSEAAKLTAQRNEWLTEIEQCYSYKNN
ncbi:hypothetical protein FJ364_02020 [Candidatus Dependentiae bacterium]|nr:hypothetical protein [Candidatus Dependentiae bacterium]